MILVSVPISASKLTPAGRAPCVHCAFMCFTLSAAFFRSSARSARVVPAAMAQASNNRNLRIIVPPKDDATGASAGGLVLLAGDLLARLRPGGGADFEHQLLARSGLGDLRVPARNVVGGHLVLLGDGR